MLNPLTGKHKRTMKEQEKINEDINYRTTSMCWECARACGGGNCPWVDSFKPVSGWKILTKESTAPGVTVAYCPMFVKGRNLSCMTDEQIKSTSTNCFDPMCRLIVLHDKERDIKLFQCPRCDEIYETHVSKCAVCKSKFLPDKSSFYVSSYTKIQARQQFFNDYQDDFPKAKFTYKQGG